MLTRISIPPGQIAVYKALAKGRMEYNEFLNIVEKTYDQIAGVFGALGRRINNTPEIHQAGLPGNCDAIRRWDRETKDGKVVYYISLTLDALDALKKEGII
jgi:hypothetical protein